MKILFHDYSSELTTEPRYMTVALQYCGVDAALWNDSRVSAFDICDQLQPNVFVTHYTMITPDIIKYLEQNNSIQLVVNVTGMSDNQLVDFEKFTANKGMNVPFVFTNSFDQTEPQTNIRYEKIPPAFDLFATQRSKHTEPLCPRAIFANVYDDAVEHETKDGDVYHLVQFTNGEINPKFDIRSNATSAHELYKRYGSFTLVGDMDFCSSQIFFDLTMNATNVIVKTDNTDEFEKILMSIFKDTGSTEDMSIQIKNQMKSHHTPFHRVGTLMRLLGDKEAAHKVEIAQGHLSEAIKEI